MKNRDRRSSITIWIVSCATLISLLLMGQASAQSLMEAAIMKGRKAARDSAAVCYYRARKLASEGKLNPAITQIQRAIEYQPREDQLHVDLSLLLWARGDSAAAIKQVYPLVHTAVPFPPAVLQLGEFYEVKGDRTRAIGLYKRMATGSKPMPAAVVRLGELAQLDGNRAEAVKQYTRATKIAPTMTTAWMRLSGLHIEQDNFSKAIRVLRSAMRSDSNMVLPQQLDWVQKRRTSYLAGVKAKKYRARIIVVNTNDEARDIMVQLKKGANFAFLAVERSNSPTKTDGGDLWFFGPGELLPELENAVKATSKGRISPITRIKGEYYIIKRLN
jgi:tetratricopeptide (TPR) repeat protein